MLLCTANMYGSSANYVVRICYAFISTLSDIDECALEIDNCDSNAICLNTEGSYECECNVGYRGNGRRCRGKQSTCTKLI